MIGKTPWSTVAVFAVTVGGILALVLTGNATNELFGVLIALLPTLAVTNYQVAKVTKQTSNGHVKDAVKQAINEVATEPPQDGSDGPVHG